MTKKIYLLLTILLVSILINPAYGKLKQLELAITSNLTAKKSHYRQFEFIDARSEIQKEAIIINEEQFNNQLISLLENVVETDSSQATMVVVLRNLYQEYINRSSKKDKFHLRISLFENKNENLYLIKTLNTHFSAEFENDKINQSRLSGAIGMFIYSNLNKTPTAYAQSCAIKEISDIPHLEKATIKLYQTDHLVDGIYENFRTFADQQPTNTVSSYKEKNFHLQNIKYIDPKSQKEVKLKNSQSYAIVIDGNAFLQIKGKYWLLEKDEDNDYFVRLQQTKDNTNRIIVNFGLIGAILTFQHKMDENIAVKINHLDGTLSVKKKEVITQKSQFLRTKTTEKTIKGDESMRTW